MRNERGVPLMTGNVEDLLLGAAVAVRDMVNHHLY
jgi:hypothetical protein